MSNQKFHNLDLSHATFLITGGAGFIGSNMVEYLLKHNAKRVRVLDNLSSGYIENLAPFFDAPNFEFINGDIRNLETCREAVKGMEYVSHQAALGSVPRSIENPILTNEVNIGGHLNMMVAANEESSVKQFVYAASSSTFGDSIELPKVEGKEGKLLSPYAVTKAVNEYYGDVFSKVYGFHTIGLRYFNIYGPKQNVDNPYAAVIPIFCKAFMKNVAPVINGDGLTSRDFTHVDNAVQANIRALFFDELNEHMVFNVACGDQVSLNDMIVMLQELTGKTLTPIYGPERLGDIKHSKASIEQIKKVLGYAPTVYFKEGLKSVYDWYVGEIHEKVN